MKLNELLNEWIRYIKCTVKVKTIFTYSVIIKNQISTIIGNYDLEQLNNSLIENFISQKIKNGNSTNGKGLSINTIYLIISILKRVLKYAYECKYINKEIILNIKLTKKIDKKIKVLSIKERQILESYCLNSKSNYIGIVLCLYTGIRLGELLALTWDDIDFHERKLSITKTLNTIKQDGKWTLHVDTPKTIKSNRVIPIPKQLLQKLKVLKKQSKSKYIITTRNNTMVDNRSYQATYSRILKKLNIKHRNFHSIRHTFATHALEFGMDIKALSEILGHNNATITLNIYCHSLFSYKQEMIDKLEKKMKQK